MFNILLVSIYHSTEQQLNCYVRPLFIHEII